jgi:phosphatidate cytidylyltransferase
MLGFATGTIWLIACLLMLGIFEAPCYPANSRILSNWFPQSERARATGVYSIGQYAGLAMFSTLLFWITPFKAGQALSMAFIAGASGTLGEFVMSALKKDAGVRYWGSRSSVTGAVGLLDRMAALCFAAPVFFHSVRWYFQLEL